MKRSILGILVGLGLSVGGFLLAARYIDEPPSITSYWPVAVGVAATLTAWLLQGTIIALLSRPQLKTMKIFDMTRVYLATQAAGAVTPFAGGEIAYQLLQLNRRGLSADYAGAVITIRSILNSMALMPAAALSVFLIPHVPFLGQASSLLPSERMILIGGAIALAVAGALIAAFIAYRRRPAQEGGRLQGSGWLQRIFAKISEWRQKATDYFRHLKDSLLEIWHQEPWVVIGCSGLMVLYWTVYPLLGVMALKAAGWDGSGWIYVFLAQYVLFVVIPLAPTPGNSGAAELAFVALMGDYAPHQALLGGVIVWRILNHYSEQVIGAFIAGRSLPEDVEFAREELGSG